MLSGALSATNTAGAADATPPLHPPRADDNTAMGYEWFHGEIGRTEAETRIEKAIQRIPRDRVAYLVRSKTGSDRDFVLSSGSGNFTIAHNIVKVMGGGSNKSFTLDIKIEGKKTRYFSSLEALLEHFATPDAGLPAGPLSFPVPNPTGPMELPRDDDLPPPPVADTLPAGMTGYEQQKKEKKNSKEELPPGIVLEESASVPAKAKRNSSCVIS